MHLSKQTNSALAFLPTRCFLQRSVEELLTQYRQAKPFPHLVLDGLFEDQALSAILDEWPAADSDSWIHEKTDHYAKSNLRSALFLGKAGYAFTSMLHSAAFLQLLTEMTGIRALLPDPYLRGAGHRVQDEGAHFELHADTNADDRCGLHRRIAMLTYLNRQWNSEDGGQLELWNRHATTLEKVIEPLFNRTVIMEVGDTHFHAVRQIARGSGAKRKSFVSYFHTIERNLIYHDSIYVPSVKRQQDTWIVCGLRNLTPPVLWRALRALRRHRFIFHSPEPLPKVIR